MINLKLKQEGITNRKFWSAAGDPEDFKCFQCQKVLLMGFMCENNRKLVLCEECQDKFKMANCQHDKRGDHQHIKFEVREDEKQNEEA